jgi:thiamine biosynthesis protein ThiS
MMKLTVNGEAYEMTGENPTVRDLVVQLGLGDQPVAVEVNKAVVPRKQHETHPLSEGDVIEVVTLVGGG